MRLSSVLCLTHFRRNGSRRCLRCWLPTEMRLQETERLAMRLKTIFPKPTPKAMSRNRKQAFAQLQTRSQKIVVLVSIQHSQHDQHSHHSAREGKDICRNVVIKLPM